MDLLWGIFHISQPVQFVRHCFGNVLCKHLTLLNVCRCVHKTLPLDFVSTSTNSYVCFELSSTEKLADDSLGLANLPAPTYWGGQVAGQMPSSSAPQWKISTFLTGQMSDTWQDCHPDSPAESLLTGYHSSPEIKVVFLFLSLFQTLSPSCLFSLGWFHF